MITSVAKTWWNRRYPNWVAEVALRYLPVVEAIRKQPPQGLILEVGVNCSGLTTYLPLPVVGVDSVMGTARPPLVTPIVAWGQALPFQRESFDYAVCMDTLEHVEVSERHLVLGELMRVTKRRVYLGCPMGSAAEQQDRELQRYYRKHNGGSFAFLDEHVANGLPRLETVLAEIQELERQSGRLIKIHCEANLNLLIHRLLIRLWMRTDPLSYALHRLAVVFVHLRRWLNVGSCYRQIVVVDFEAHGR
ncbi:MAG: class I SAM-dependent methyltransferase [Nitrospira sp.]|nr:class I SAM-dependent methyltransferase [Nitrospira sp.]